MGVVEVLVPELERLERVHQGAVITVCGGCDEAAGNRGVRILKGPEGDERVLTEEQSSR